MVATPSLDHVPPLPIPLTSFVGREREIAAVSTLLRREDVRLLTLTGAGGVGKTRLALAVATALAEEFAGGVWFVDLSPLGDPRPVLPTIAQALGVREAGDQPLIERLQAVLGEHETLLLLDNFERVVAAGPGVAGLLPTCPALKLLVTSRMPLRLSAEWAFPVPPLAVPDRGIEPAVDELITYEAMALFVARAGTVIPGYALTGDNAPPVTEICRRLDGLPLAIELAAARCKILPPRAMLTRLERRLPLLTGGPRDVPARHRTMRDAIAWSHDLLSPKEQALFRRLAVFAGGFTLEAAEAVAGSVRDDFDVLAGVDALIEQSLVHLLDSADDEPRYGMRETIREFALDQLDASGEGDDVRRAHAAYFLSVAEQAAAAGAGAEARTWHCVLEAEHDNFRAAMRRALDHGEIETALRLAIGQGYLWLALGHGTEGRQWLAEALERSQCLPEAVRWEATFLMGRLAWRQGDYAVAQELVEECLRATTEMTDQARIADAFQVLAYVKMFQGNVRQALTLHEEALAIGRRLGDSILVAHALCHLGTLLNLGTLDQPGACDDRDRAESCCEEGLAIFRECGDEYGVARALHGLAYIAYKRQDFPRALALGRETIALRWELHDHSWIEPCLHDLADIAGLHGQAERAARLYGAAEALGERMGTEGVAPVFRVEYEREVAFARNQLGDEAFAAAWTAGRRLSLEEAVAEAFAVTLDPPIVAGRPAAGAAGLSPRELDVLRLIVDGQTDREIAAALFVSPRTAMSHVQHIFAKLGVHDRKAAAAFAAHDIV